MKKTSPFARITTAGVVLSSAVTAGVSVAGEAASPLSTVAEAAAKSVAVVSDSREFEASFLKVPQTCKSSHTSFVAVSVALENVPAEIRLIHAEVEDA